MRNFPRSFLVRSTLLFTLLLSSCGGGGGDSVASPPVQSPPVQQWPQSLAFTDFTGGQDYFLIRLSVLVAEVSPVDCQLCVNLQGVARSSTELGKLRPDVNTYPDWPVPYNNKPYAELPIDYATKIAVVLEDLGSGARYRHSIQKVEETEDKVIISVLKCTVIDLYGKPNIISLGLLIPKTNKPIEVLTIQTGNPPAFGSGPNGLGGCN